MHLNKEVVKIDVMYHHGILGQKWGVRRFQNKDGTLTASGQKRLEKKDAKWAHKNHNKIVSKVRKDVSKELDQYADQLLKKPSSITSKGKISSSAINSYNRKMAELMSNSAKNIIAPSGRVIQFVAKRGEIGVHMAIADVGYDMQQLKNGVWASGRVAYKKKNIDMV